MSSHYNARYPRYATITQQTISASALALKADTSVVDLLLPVEVKYNYEDASNPGYWFIVVNMEASEADKIKTLAFSNSPTTVYTVVLHEPSTEHSTYVQPYGNRVFKIAGSQPANFNGYTLIPNPIESILASYRSGAQAALDGTITTAMSGTVEKFYAYVEGLGGETSLESFVGANDEFVNNTNVRTFDETNQPISYIQSSTKMIHNVYYCALESRGIIDTKKTVHESIPAESAIGPLFWTSDGAGGYTKKTMKVVTDPFPVFDESVPNGYDASSFVTIDQDLKTHWSLTNNQVPTKIFYKTEDAKTDVNIRHMITHSGGTLGAFLSEFPKTIYNGMIDAVDPAQNAVNPMDPYADPAKGINSRLFAMGFFVNNETALKSYIVMRTNVVAISNSNNLVGNTYQPDPTQPNFRAVDLMSYGAIIRPSADVVIENVFAAGLLVSHPGEIREYGQHANSVPFVEYQVNKYRGAAATAGPLDATWEWTQDTMNTEFFSKLGTQDTFYYIDANSPLNSTITDIQARFKKPVVYGTNQQAYDSNIGVWNGGSDRSTALPAEYSNPTTVHIETETNSVDVQRFAFLSYIPTIKQVPHSGAWSAGTSVRDITKVMQCMSDGLDKDGEILIDASTLKEYKSPSFQPMSLTSAISGNFKSENGFGKVMVDGLFGEDPEDDEEGSVGNSWRGGNNTAWYSSSTEGSWRFVFRNALFNNATNSMNVLKSFRPWNTTKFYVKNVSTHLNNTQIYSNLNDAAAATNAFIDAHSVVANVNIIESKLPTSLVPEILDSTLVPPGTFDQLSDELVQGYLAIRNDQNIEVDKLVSAYSTGISKQWSVEFVNASLSNGQVVNIDNILNYPNTITSSADLMNIFNLMTIDVHTYFTMKCEFKVASTAAPAMSLMYDIIGDDASSRYDAKYFNISDPDTAVLKSIVHDDLTEISPGEYHTLTPNAWHDLEIVSDATGVQCKIGGVLKASADAAVGGYVGLIANENVTVRGLRLNLD